MSDDHHRAPAAPTDAASRAATGADGWFWASDVPADGARVEMRHRGDGGMDVRTSADPDKVLSYTRNEWLAFLDGCENFEFDRLAAETDDAADAG